MKLIKKASETFGDSKDFFDDFFNIPFIRNQTLRTDIKELENNYLISIDLPGYEKKDITLDIEDGYLTISVKKEENLTDKKEDDSYIRRERYINRASRSFYIGDISEKEIKAHLENGILTIEVPKNSLNNDQNKKYVTIE